MLPDSLDVSIGGTEGDAEGNLVRVDDTDHDSPYVSGGIVADRIIVNPLATRGNSKDDEFKGESDEGAEEIKQVRKDS